MAAGNAAASKGALSVPVVLARVGKYSTYLRRYWWVAILTMAAGIGWGCWTNTQKPSSYISVARMMVNGHISLPEGAVYSEELNNFYGTQMELMRSSEVQRRAATRVESEQPDLKAGQVNLTVAVQQGTSLFVLTAVGDDPKYTQLYLDACMDEYVRLKRELRSETSDTALTSITDELIKLDKDLQTGQDDLLAFQKSNDVVFLEEEGNSAAKYLSQLDGQLSELQTEYRLLNSLDLDHKLAVEQPKQALGADPSAVGAKGDTEPPPSGPEMEYLKAKQQVQILQAEKQRHAKYMRPQHPLMVQLDSQIAEQQRLITLFRDQSEAGLVTRRESIRLQIENLQTSIKEWQAKALDLTQRMSEFNRLKDRVDRTKALSDRLTASIQSVDVNSNLQEDVVSVLETASAASATKLDIAKAYALGAATGLFAGLGIIFVIDFMDDRIGSALEWEGRFPEQIIVQVPEESAKGRLNLLEMDDSHRVFTESYRNLRSALLFMPLEEPRPKSFLITSAVPGEGKSTVAANFAITMASAGSRTLLVDGDLRKGVLHEFFGGSINPGLSEVLEGAIKWQEAVRDTSIPGLFLLTRGKALPGKSESFVSKITDSFLKEIYREYDYIIVDSAPVLANDDTTSLAPKIDAALFVVRTGLSPANLVRHAIDALGTRQVNLLGIVLNSVARNITGYYYHRYAEYYSQESARENS
jgi:polysaccharide biosynthesis transport protein